MSTRVPQATDVSDTLAVIGSLPTWVIGWALDGDDAGGRGGRGAARALVEHHDAAHVTTTAAAAASPAVSQVRRR